MDLSSSFVKLVFLFNLILFCIGIFIIYQGVQSNNLHIDGEKVDDVNKLVGKLPTFIIFTGVVISLVSFFGCYGALFESPMWLSWYISLVLLLIIFQLALAVYIYQTDSLPKDDAIEFFDELMKKYEIDARYKTYVDKAQSWLKCCGARGAADWIVLKMKNPPQSCCEPGTSLCEVEKSYQKSCVDAFNNWIKNSKKDYILYMGIGIGFQVIVIIVTCYARSHIRKR